MGLVAYKIEIDGKDVTPAWAAERRLLSITVVDKKGASADSCTLTLNDRKPHIKWPPIGAALRVSLGATKAELTDLGTYTIDAPVYSTPPDRLTVTGHSASYVTEGEGLPLDAHRFRVWSDVSMADLAETIARDHGLVSRVSLALQGTLVGSMEQIDESDLQFLTDVAARFDATVRVKRGRLEVLGAGEVLPGTTLGPADVEKLTVPFGERIRPDKVEARWFNPKSGAGDVVSVGSGDRVRVLTELFDTAKAAKSAATSELKKKDRASAPITIELRELRTEIASGTEVALAGFRSEVDTIWSVTEARHDAGQNNHTTLTAERSVA